MPKFRFAAPLYMMLVFVSGALVGGAAYRLYSLKTVTSSPPRPQRSPEEFRRRYVSELHQRLNLTDDQVTSLQTILDETRQRYMEIHRRNQPEMEAIQKRQVERVRGILTDAQRPLYDQWREEREKRRRQGKKPGPPPGPKP